MRFLSFRRIQPVLLVLAVMALTACETGWKVGNMQIINPKSPLVSDGIQITRRHATLATQDKPDWTESLVVDFTNGKGAFTDRDGRVYAVQFSAEQNDQLRATVGNRQWKIDSRLPVLKAPEAVFYGLTVSQGGKPLKEQAFWAEPPRKPLPPAMSVFEDAINFALRTAHPLSEQVDLLK